MSVTLAPEIESRIRSWIDSGRYPNANDLILDALQLIEERDSAQLLKLRQMVRAGSESGDPVDLAPELWDELERESEEAYLRGEQPDPDVCP